MSTPLLPAAATTVTPWSTAYFTAASYPVTHDRWVPGLVPRLMLMTFAPLSVAYTMAA